MQIYRHPTFIQMAIFAVLGPPIGAAGSLLWDQVMSGPVVPMGLHLWLGVTLFAYLYGLPAALVTGWSAARSRAMSPSPNLTHRGIRFGVPIAIGAVSSILFSLVTIASDPDPAIASAGAFAAMICTGLAELLRLRPNNSVKPNPLRASA